METVDSIKDRMSIRAFKDEPISDDIIKELIELATQAPSAGNLQDWEFIIVKDKKKRESFSDASSFGQKFIAKAPVVIIICSNLERMSPYGERGKTLYSIQDIAAATENLILAAWDKGIGSCWVGAFDEEKVKKILSIPKNIRPLVMIPLGYPSKVFKKPSRRDIKEVMHWERF